VGLKARRGDLSGPVLAVLVTIVLLAIGAAIIATFVLLGATQRQGVLAIVGEPTIMRAGANDFIANVTVKNVGSAPITLSPATVYLNITGTRVPANFISRTTLPPGETATIGFVVTGRWPLVAGVDNVSGVLAVRDVGTIGVTFRVIR
jgi:hypothetical protein